MLFIFYLNKNSIYFLKIEEDYYPFYVDFVGTFIISQNKYIYTNISKYKNLFLLIKEKIPTN